MIGSGAIIMALGKQKMTLTENASALLGIETGNQTQFVLDKE